MDMQTAKAVITEAVDALVSMAESGISARDAVIADLRAKLAAVPKPVSPPAPDPEPPAPPTEAPEARIRRLIGQTWAMAGAVNALPDSAMPGWIAHFLPKLHLEDEDLRDEMLEIGLLDGVLVLPEASPAPIPNPAPAPAPGGLVLTADQMVSHMDRPAGLVLRGVPDRYGWKHRGYVYQGVNPDFRHTPSWFTGKGLGVGRFLLPWFVQFEGEGNTEQVADMGFSGIALLALIAGEWRPIVVSWQQPGGYRQTQGGDYYGGSNAPVWTEYMIGDRLVRQLQIRSGIDYHGYSGSGRVAAPQGKIEALQVQVAIVGPANGEWGMHIGCDWYLSQEGEQMIVPGLAISTPMRLRPGLQILTATSLTDAGVQEPGSGITSAQLRANVPPIVV